MTRPTRAAPALAALLLIFVSACASRADPTNGHVSPPTATAGGATQGQQTDWLQFGFDAARGGVNPNERRISAGTVAQLHRLWQVSLPDVADSSPAYVHGLALPDKTVRDVLFVTTRDGRLLARDAATGAALWARQPAGSRITHSSPLVDATRQYVYAYGLDGTLHKYRTDSGQETTSGGWPVLITRMTGTEKESSSINGSGGRIYVSTSGYLGDAPPYQGHIVIISAADASTHVFNSLCSNLAHVLRPNECPEDQSGIWARAGVVVDPATGNLFAVTGNGAYDANTGGNDWGDTVLELSPDGTRVLDSYTPADFDQLDASDADLGSTAPALLPRLPTSKTPDLLVQGGKDALLRVLDRRNLSGKGGPRYVGGGLHTLPTPGGCALLTQPTIWTDPASQAVWVFVDDDCAMGAYQVVTDAAGGTTLKRAWTVNVKATTPIIAGNVLFAATSGAVRALDPRTGTQLWSSAGQHAGGSIDGIHWESPIVANGVLYCADENNHLTAYGI